MTGPRVHVLIYQQWSELTANGTYAAFLFRSAAQADAKATRSVSDSGLSSSSVAHLDVRVRGEPHSGDRNAFPKGAQGLVSRLAGLQVSVDRAFMDQLQGHPPRPIRDAFPRRHRFDARCAKLYRALCPFIPGLVVLRR